MKPEPKTSGPVAALLGLSNWFLPGLGYMLAKDYRRGIALFVILNGLFFIGLSYDGFVYWTPFDPRSPEFNIVASLTLISQFCHGIGTALLLFLQQNGGEEYTLFLRDPGTTYSDIGAFHILVAGILNYFASVKLYDDLTGFVDPEQEAREKRRALKKQDIGNKSKDSQGTKNTDESSSDASDLDRISDKTEKEVTNSSSMEKQS